jgi:hypothetical protein
MISRQLKYIHYDHIDNYEGQLFQLVLIHDTQKVALI